MPTDRPNLIDRSIVDALLLAAAPEREADLEALWTKYDPGFVVEEDQAGLVFRASRDRITFSAKTFQHDWLVAFAAWKAFRAYSPAIVVADFLAKPLSPEMLTDDTGLSAEVASSDELLYCARELRRADSADQVTWPPDIPAPAPDSAGFSIESQAAFNLLSIATAATFLHEVRHLRYFQDEDVPAIRRDEEKLCDEYAREFLTSYSHEYARVVAKPTAAILNLRTMGMALAAYIIHEATPIDQQGGSDDYPSSADRFISLVGDPDLPDGCDCWVFASALLLSALKRTPRFRTPVLFTNAKDLFLSLCQMLP
jgi:hypothetical protein